MNLNYLRLNKFIILSLKVLGSLVVETIVILLIGWHWAWFNGFAYSCSKLQEGMTVEQAKVIMKKYINNESYFFHEDEDVIGWGGPDYECGAKIKNGRILQIKAGFNRAWP